MQPVIALEMIAKSKIESAVVRKICGVKFPKCQIIWRNGLFLQILLDVKRNMDLLWDFLAWQMQSFALLNFYFKIKNL